MDIFIHDPTSGVVVATSAVFIELGIHTLHVIVWVYIACLAILTTFCSLTILSIFVTMLLYTWEMAMLCLAVYFLWCFLNKEYTCIYILVHCAFVITAFCRLSVIEKSIFTIMLLYTTDMSMLCLASPRCINGYQRIYCLG